MSIINKNSIQKVIITSLVILAILALGAVAFMPKNASAYAERYGYARPYSNDFVDTFESPNYGGSNYVTPPSTPAPASNGQVLGASTTKSVAKAPAKTTTPVKQEFSDLTANAIYGSDSFLPSGLTQWVILAIIILIIIILVRKFFGREASYHSTPLKHS